MNMFETVIGLEVHVQLKTQSKIFCACSTHFEAPANANICPVCSGQPGVLPVFNERALALAVRVSLALNCSINPTIYFERKNYFYPDLPKNYQISQYAMPLGQKGYLQIPGGVTIKINRVHLEEDAGKLVHQERHSLVDLNRTGIPLLEIVSEPDLCSASQAYEYLSALKLTLQYIGASDCDMEKGTLRCDANISLKPPGSTTLGTKVEIKNLNTFKGVRSALEYEEKRQAGVLSEGGRIIQETRLWDPDGQRTQVMRTKEEAHDYRYFPEPDLLDIFVPAQLIERERALVGELALARRQRLIEQYELGEKEAEVLTGSRRLADFFEEVVGIYPHPRMVSNWLLGPFLEQVNALDGAFDSVKISAHNFASIIEQFAAGRLNNLAAKKALSLSITTNEDIERIIEREQLVQVSDEGALNALVEEVVRDQQKAVLEFKQGKQEAMQFLIGQVMKKSKGKANPKVARQLLERRIG